MFKFLYFLQKVVEFRKFLQEFSWILTGDYPLVSMEEYNEMEMLLRSGNVLLHYSLLWKIFFPLFLALILYKAPAQSSDPALFKNTVCLTFYWESFVKGFSETLCIFEDWGLGTWFLMNRWHSWILGRLKRPKRQDWSPRGDVERKDGARQTLRSPRFRAPACQK